MMWHKPGLLKAVADLLFLLGGAALLFAAIVWGAPRLTLFPLEEIAVAHELQEVQRSEVEQSLAEVMRGNFFTVNVDALRLALEELAWVRRAEVWRKWPGRVEVRIEEHQVAALWGNQPGQLVNTYGEVFAAELSRAQSLPRLSGPLGASAELLRRHDEFAEILQPIGRQPAEVLLSPRLAWLLKLEDGLLVELGREQAKAPIRVRLQRFVDYYATITNSGQARPVAVDMRYPNGFALRFAASAGQDVKGKK